MIVKILHSDHIPRDVAHRGDPVLPLVAGCAPGVPVIRRRNILQVVRNRAHARDSRGLPCGNIERVLTCRHLGFPLANHDDSVARILDINPVAAIGKKRDARVRGVNFESVARSRGSAP